MRLLSSAPLRCALAFARTVLDLLVAYPALTLQRVLRAYGTCWATIFRPYRDWFVGDSRRVVLSR